MGKRGNRFRVAFFILCILAVSVMVASSANPTYEWSSGTITKSGSYTVSSGSTVILESATEVVLGPNFVAESGSDFRACIGKQFAALSFTVNGTVMNNGAAAAGVRIIITGRTAYGQTGYERDVVKSVTTDSQGRFSVVLPKGTYTIRAPHYQVVSGPSTLTVNYADVSLATVGVGNYQPVLTTYYHQDMLGNTVAQTDEGGVVVMRADYYPFGDMRTSDGMPERRLFTGKERDDTWLDYFGARYYDATIGRFTSIDPVGGKIDDPQSYNRYAYCLNNPYKYVDPDGRIFVPAIYALAAGAVMAAPYFEALAFQAFEIMNDIELGRNSDAAIGMGLSVAPELRSAKGIINEVRSLTKGTRVPNAGGAIRSFVQEADQIYYRVFTEKQTGSFLTAVPPSSSSYAREALSLPSENTAAYIQKVLVPAGTRLQRSRALPAFGHRGGAEQFELLQKIPDKNFGLGELLP